MTTLLPAQVSIPDTVIFQELSGEVVLLNMANDRYYGLDDVGAKMWQVLAEQSDTTAALAKLVAYYAAPEGALREDLAQLIQRLHTAGLLQVA